MRRNGPGLRSAEVRVVETERSLVPKKLAFPANALAAHARVEKRPVQAWDGQGCSKLRKLVSELEQLVGGWLLTICQQIGYTELKALPSGNQRDSYSGKHGRHTPDQS